MLPTTQMLAMIGGKAASDNMRSIISGLTVYGRRAGLDLPHRLAQYIAQLAHESAAFKYDQEIASGRAYEGRADLGNTQPGDGVRFKGRTAGQITGRFNYRKFTKWCRDAGLNPPDFEEHPELLNTDPWEGLGPIWFWVTHKLNDYADKNDIEMITRIWNGGLNGYDDRLHYYTRTGLMLLGRPADGVVGFQRWAQEQKLLPANTDKTKQDDGVPGPKTRAAIHMALVALGKPQMDLSPAVVDTAPAPVVTETVVVPPGSDKRGWLWGPLSGISLTGIINTFADFPWQYKLGLSVVAFVLVIVMLFIGERIIRRAKALIAEAAK